MRTLLCTFLALLGAFAANATCSASFTYTTSGLTASITNTSTYSGYTNPYANYYLYYGDGSSTNPGPGSTTNHTYTTPGTYTVVLMQYVIDSVGTTVQYCSDSAVQTITVNALPCSSSILVAAAPSSNPTRTFTANNYNNTPGATYTWYFGDGTSATGSPVTHTYTGIGNYSVNLVTNAGGCTDSTFTQVSVTSTFDCANSNAAFSTSVSGNVVTFINNSTPLNPAGVSTSYFWSFGDGYASTSAAPTHAYINSGTYNVWFTITWRDSVTQAFLCSDSVLQSVTVVNSFCDSVNGSFSASISGNTVAFTNTSYLTGPVTTNTFWYYGDGNTGNGPYTLHTYANSGTYSVTMLTQWVDSLTQNLLCQDTVYQNVTISAPNVISGAIYYDSTLMSPVDTFKVWLIQYDSVAQVLYAVDSQFVGGGFGNIQYAFNNKPAGYYLTKAALLNGQVSGVGLIPTYHLNSYYWYSATPIIHGGGSSSNKDIWMQQGLVTSGPGFIGGLVTQGANKGTSVGEPVPNLLVLLRDANDQVIQMTHTNADGKYSFSNVPVGSYSVFPEELGYTTTPYTSIAINNTQPTINGIAFKKTDDEIRPIPTAVSNISATAVANSIYPNPAHNFINVVSGADASSLHVRIVNITGQVTATYEFHNVHKGAAVNIPVKDQPAGIYLIQAETEQSRWTEQIQIK